jgi:hypothetical protein
MINAQSSRPHGWRAEGELWRENRFGESVIEAVGDFLFPLIIVKFSFTKRFGSSFGDVLRIRWIACVRIRLPTNM